jgi:hypothetical protein
VTDPVNNASYDPIPNKNWSEVGTTANTSKQSTKTLPIEKAQLPIAVVGQNGRCIATIPIESQLQDII